MLHSGGSLALQRPCSFSSKTFLQSPGEDKAVHKSTTQGTPSLRTDSRLLIHVLVWCVGIRPITCHYAGHARCGLEPILGADPSGEAINGRVRGGLARCSVDRRARLHHRCLPQYTAPNLSGWSLRQGCHLRPYQTYTWVYIITQRRGGHYWCRRGSGGSVSRIAALTPLSILHPLRSAARPGRAGITMSNFTSPCRKPRSHRRR